MRSARAGVILMVNGQVALMRHEWPERLYYLFPGGGVEPGETIEQAAVREAREELGLEVRLRRLVAISAFTADFLGEKQYYYEAEVVGGQFGSGDGEEFSGQLEGRFAPVLVPLAELERLDVKPPALARLVAAGLSAAAPVCLVEQRKAR